MSEKLREQFNEIIKTLNVINRSTKLVAESIKRILADQSIPKKAKPPIPQKKRKQSTTKKTIVNCVNNECKHNDGILCLYPDGIEYCEAQIKEK